MNIEHNIVNFTLSFGKFAVYGKGSGNVRGVTLVLSTGIDQDQIAVLERHIVFDIVQDRSVVAAADDRVVRNAARTFVFHVGFHQRFDLALVHAGLDLFHRENVSLSGDGCGGLHLFDLLGRFMQSHLAKYRRRVDDSVRRICCFETLNTLI